MASNNTESNSKLPVILKDIDKNYIKPEHRNELVAEKKYDKIDTNIGSLVKLGTNGVTYVAEDAFSVLFQTTKPKGAYVFGNQIPDKAKRKVGDKDYAHSSSVIGLLDKKSQEVRDAEKQAILQYGRDSIINISDSLQAQDIRRKVDSFTNKEIKKLRRERSVDFDEVTGDAPKKGFAFHHSNPKEIHTDPEDVLDSTKGINVNPDNHSDIHRNNINDEEQLENYIKNKKAANVDSA